MVFGILKDTKVGEHRVICTPIEVRSIIHAGHKVIAQRSCGTTAGFDDDKYLAAGAEIVDTAKEIWSQCDMVAKVKEFTSEEYPLMREGQLLLGCIHPAASREQVDALLASRCIAFTAEDSHRFGSPNCEAAGKQGALFGLESMLTINGGRGKYVGGFAGSPRMNVLVLGGGLVGQGALDVLDALGACCTVMDVNISVLRRLKDRYGGRINAVFCSKEAITEMLPDTDMVLNCVRWQKERCDFLIDRKMLSMMESGSVIVDISGDTPGAIETTGKFAEGRVRYVIDGIVHFCSPNIPGAVANSASVAYAAEMLPMILSLLCDGVRATCIRDGYFRRSLTAYKGYLTHEETSALQNRPWIRPEDILGISGEQLDPAPPQSRTRSKNFYSRVDL